MCDIFRALFDRHRNYLSDACISAADEIGIFDVVTANPMSAAHLADRLSVSLHRLEAMLWVLTTEGRLIVDDLGVRAVHDAEPASRKLQNARPNLSPDVRRHGWERLADVLRDDRPLRGPDLDGLVRYHTHLWSVAQPVAAEIAECWPAGITRGLPLVVDVGCGAGAYGAAYLTAQTDVRAVFVDNPDVLTITKTFVTNLDRARFLPGAFETLEPEADSMDTVVFSNLVHWVDGPTVMNMLLAAKAWLRPRGQLLVKDLFRRGGGAGPDLALFFNLNMAIYSTQGRVHPTAQIEDWCRAAGFEDVESATLMTSSDAVVTRALRAGLSR